MDGTVENKTVELSGNSEGWTRVDGVTMSMDGTRGFKITHPDRKITLRFCGCCGERLHTLDHAIGLAELVWPVDERPRSAPN